VVGGELFHSAISTYCCLQHLDNRFSYKPIIELSGNGRKVVRNSSQYIYDDSYCNKDNDKRRLLQSTVRATSGLRKSQFLVDSRMYNCRVFTPSLMQKYGRTLSKSEIQTKTNMDGKQLPRFSISFLSLLMHSAL